ncbi:SRPBCC family protein [Streptomyces sp. NPDC001380]|uniref:SRPBCC family protein n=1 Tax=Streptomyces sp. NPDC001380 TaxID=3364566 RepID=UPI0036CC865C
MERRWSVEEAVLVAAEPERVYRAVADVRSTGRWSPECRAVRVPRPPVAAGTRFAGLNRRGPWVWFTECRVTRADPGRCLEFRVTAFRMPVARWGHRFAAQDGGTRVTEYREDLRTGRAGRAASLLGRLFTGTRPAGRHLVNRAGMGTTLQRLGQALEG